MRRISNFIYIIKLIIIIAIIGIVVKTCTMITNKNVEKKDFENKIYKAIDDQSFIAFGNFSNTILFFNEKYYTIIDVKLEENIFIINALEQTFFIVVTSNEMLFITVANTYLHLVDKV